MTNQPTISERHNKKPPTPEQKKATELWQKFLNIKVDGGFGPITTAATKAYQKSHSLKDDGEVGPKTWATVPQPVTSSPSKAPVQQATPKQQAIATSNAAVTAANTIVKQAAPKQPVTPRPAPAPTATAAVKQAATATAAAVKHQAASVRAATTKQVKGVSAAVKSQPLWLRILSGVAVAIGGIAVVKAATGPKRRSA